MGLGIAAMEVHPRLKKSHRRLRPPLPFFVTGKRRPLVLTRPTRPPVYRPPLSVNPETGEIGWSAFSSMHEELEDLGLL